MLVTQLCPAVCEPMDYSLLGSSVLCPWNSPGKNTGVGCHFLFQGFFLTQEWNPGLQSRRQILYSLSHHGSRLLGPLFFVKNQKLTLKELLLSLLKIDNVLINP